MRLRLTIILFLNIVGVFEVLAQNTFQKSSFTAADGFVLPYQVLYPEGYDANKRYPIVLFLHGSGERGNDNEAQLAHASKQFLGPEFRKKHPCIVLFPQCPADQYWGSVTIDRTTSPFELRFDYAHPATQPLAAAIALVQDFITAKKADPKRIYITGLSMGGMGTFEAVHRHPKMFAAAMPICGGGDTEHYTKKAKRVPFWIFHGDADIAVSVEMSRNMVACLKKRHTNFVRYTEYAGVNHNSWDNAFAEPEYLGWMFAQHRK